MYSGAEACEAFIEEGAELFRVLHGGGFTQGGILPGLGDVKDYIGDASYLSEYGGKSRVRG